MLLIPAQGLANERYAGIVWDITSGKVLYSDDADKRRYPASLTKMMTLYVLFEDLEKGQVKLDTPLTVSAHAAAQVPTKLGLKAGETISVEAAIKGLVTRSANDAAVVIAENLAGSEPAFAERMTRTAHDLGMTSTQFRNASGLPNPDQVTTARDMMLLGTALQVRFPRHYSYFKTRSFTYRGRTYRSHNRLVGRVNGVDGIKTGYIRASGFNLVTSVRRGGRKIVAVVLGGRTAKRRDNHMASLISRYLPKAKVGKGYAAEVLAMVGKKPVVVASADPSLAATALPPVATDATVAAQPDGVRAGPVIQIGALPSSAAAEKALKDAQSAHGEILAGLKPVTEPYKNFVRARFAGFSDRKAAQDACEQLRKEAVPCLVLEL
ncbi:D-alanyl-D-alanine carboxypeptidase [Microvirga roseola]|uniref:D-alanyl-D-alanine carboxypeptidase n=1 Tax=Microvirga roseola TaxID=2883126 RepID=UPI001E553B1E|nr:D-alanyl-D-alanine carboxypeptidase family protein [Microvirga roseola]